jgi:SAM-dependent methyltransferase
MKNRLRPAIWISDAYPLRLLATCLESVVTRLFGQRPGGVIVDFGCGDSPYRPLFDARSLRYLNCDLPGSGAAIIFHPGQAVPVADRSADGVVSFQVLEHVWNLDWYLQEACRMLKDDGVLVLSTHGVWPYHPHPTDFRRWTRPGLVREIETYGFDVKENHALVGPLAWTMLFQSMALGAVLGKIPLIGKFITGTIATLTNPWLALADKITPTQWASDNAAIYLIVATKKTTNGIV